jgi:hypothetical protein
VTRWAHRPGAGLAGLLLLAACAPQSPVEGPAPAVQIIPRETVLVGGWISDTEAALEAVLPAAAPAAEDGSADETYRLRGMDDAGEPLFELTFGERDLAEVPGQPVRRFMLAAPIGPAGAAALAALELDAGEGRVVARQATSSAAELAEALSGGEVVRVRALPGERVRVRWDPGRIVVLRLRDPATGSVLAIDRDGEVIVAAAGDTLEIAASDGVRSAAARFSIR